MSTSTSRRMKERGVLGRTAAALTGKISPVSGKSISTGKENPKPRSRVRSATPKPSVQSMARIDKSAAAKEVEDPRSRRSTSSVPRGRSSSPSEFTRVLSDLRKNSSRVSLGPPQRKVVGVHSKGLSEKTSEKCELENRVLKDLVKNRETLSELKEDMQEKEEVRVRVEKKILKDYQENEKIKITAANGINEIKQRNLSSSSVKKSENSLELDPKSNKEMKLKSTGVMREDAMKKYPSKLHEKLAFLEGKVKRIASDIKRTKEILDLNNPDASKVILSDIQDKISGIEKAMGHVVSSDGNGVKSEETHREKEEKDGKNVKSSVKGLNVEDLEARLFPHHKLIRDRNLSKSTSRTSTVDVLETEESKSTLNVNEEKVSSIDENAITMEFLSSIQDEPEITKIQEMDNVMSSVAESSSLNVSNSKDSVDALLMAAEKLNEFDNQERLSTMICDEEIEDNCTYKVNDIGTKTSTGGWFVSEGESVLLTHDDGCCSFHDIVNSEEKAEYKPPAEISPNIWRDCWIIRASNTEGCNGKYVIAASAGNSGNSGFCSWDFYTKDIQASHFENDNRQWWYRPCGPLIISAASSQKMVQIYDIRDGEEVMKWGLQKPVLAMDYSSPLQWRTRGKVVVAESDAITLWDVSSLSSRPLLSVSSSGRTVSALHVNNHDAELGGGVRKRISSAEAEGNDGVFCTADSINVLDFRCASGIGLKIPKVGVDVQSTFSCGDNIYIGCSSLKSTSKKAYSSQIQQFSLRKQKLFSTYTLPESNASNGFTALTQVWGNTNIVMGVCELGLFVFDAMKDYGLPSLSYGIKQNAKDIIGPDDMFCPSFDYSGSRVLLISKDRMAQWRYLE